MGAKIGRAQEHFDAVHGEIRAWHNTRPYRIEKEVNADFTRYSCRLRISTRPALERWSLIVSDCVNNLRSALDYMVYAVALRESATDPPPDHRLLQFPIADTPDKFASAAAHRLKTLSPDVQSIFESVQPYNRPYPGLPPLLSILRDFNDSDKHRLLHVMMNAAPQGSFRNIENLRAGQIPAIEYTPIDIEDGSEIAALVFDTPTPNIKYQLVSDCVIAMSHTPNPYGGPSWSDVGTVLVRLIPEVRTVTDIVGVLYSRLRP